MYDGGGTDVPPACSGLFRGQSLYCRSNHRYGDDEHALYHDVEA